MILSLIKNCFDETNLGLQILLYRTSPHYGGLNFQVKLFKNSGSFIFGYFLAKFQVEIAKSPNSKSLSLNSQIFSTILSFASKTL